MVTGHERRSLHVDDMMISARDEPAVQTGKEIEKKESRK